MIELDHVTKRFVRRERGRRRGLRQRVEHVAVDDVSLRIEPGEFVGYLGPNGAGKSTTIKLLTGILVATSGSVRVMDLDPARQRREVASQVGVVFGQRTQLWWDLPLADSFELMRHIYAIPAPTYRRNLDRFGDLLDLGPFLQTPVRQLSLGQRMRGDLTAALLHDPQLVYLDEPTIGLDVVAKAAVRDFLATENRERGVTVLLTSHDLADVERLCSRVIVIDHGRLVHDGPLTALADRLGDHRRLIVTFAEAQPPFDLRGAASVRADGVAHTFDVTGSVPDVIGALMQRHPVVDLRLEEPTVEQVVTRLFRGT